MKNNYEEWKHLNTKSETTNSIILILLLLIVLLYSVIA